jgi:coenzyme Q-binding protein COQ10
MKQSKKNIEVNHNARELYSIVLKIEEYPEYIPWCSNIEIIDRKKNEIKANMIVNYNFFPTQKFTSKVCYNFEKKQIKTNYIEGPLKDLYTTWEFVELSKNRTKIIFIVSFEFKNYMYQKLAELFFPLIEDKMIKSFIKRADNILD